MPITGPTISSPTVLLQDTISAAIKKRARLEYGDYPEMAVVDIPLDGTTRRIDIEDAVEGQAYDVLEPTGLIVTLNGTPLIAGTDYILDSRSGVVALVNMPTAGSTLSITGTNYQFYVDEELDDFLYSATLKHTHQKVVSARSVDTQGFVAYSHMQQTLATLPEIEYHPLAIFTAIEALWTLAGDAAYDMDVNTADGTSLPRMQRYQGIMNQIETLTERYKELCFQIGNCGFWRIHDGGVLRRVSLFTGRLIPLRAPRELDDGGFASRILTPIDVPVGVLDNPNTIPCQQYNPVAQATNPWSALIEIDGVNLLTTGYLVTASISDGSRTSALVPITVVVQDATHVELSLTGAVTATLPPYAPWRVTVTYPDGHSEPVVSGSFLTEYLP